MNKFCSHLKTSDKITFLFTLFNFLSLIILLVWVNIIYFFAWYSNQRAESMYDMNINYSIYNSWKSENNLQAFKEYILQKDTLILPELWDEIVCSVWVESKIHIDILKIKDDYFYNDWEKTYFIFSQYYEWIWDVKVFFDTTPYVKSQILIIKISLIIIFISIFLYWLIWRKITTYSLKNLKIIAKKAKYIDIETKFEEIEITWNTEDEINILAKTLNKSFIHIHNQTSNLKQFITDVSHEFKTPLMVINSQIDLYNKKLEKWKLKKNDIELLLLKIKEKTLKLNRLLETFFLLSRIENWIEKLETKNIDLSHYIKDFVSNYIKNNDLDIKIIFKINWNLNIYIEENTFNILFENILSNAIKFSNNNIKIEIWINENSFWIKDFWEWIEEKKLTKIWDKFYRNDTNKEWFWVWLFIVKRLVDLYKWKIEVKSELWKCSKFIFKVK